MAQPINSWAEFKKVLKELKKDEVKEKFSTIIIDTADIAYDYCTKYILANAKRPDGGYGVDKVSDIPYGQGYGMIGNEFDEQLRSIVQLDYGLVLISHATDKTFKDEQGNEFNKFVPTLDKRATNIVSRMADIIGYARTVEQTEIIDGETQTHNVVKLFLRGTTRFMAGSRFKYTPDFIDFTYQNLVNAIADAIDKQTEQEGAEYFTDKRSNLYTDTTRNLDFDELVSQFDNMVKGLIDKAGNEKFQEYWSPRIVEITDRFLGKGQKVSQCSREQVEALSLIVDDLQELIKKENN